MISDMIDAIVEYGKGNDEWTVECLMELSNMCHGANSVRVDDTIRAMGYCPYCGEELVTYEIHSYFEGYPMNGTETKCPYCDE